MHITRKITVLGLLTASTIAIACSDSGTSQPLLEPRLATSGGDSGGIHTPPDTTQHTPPDSSHHTPPDTSHHTGPDTAGKTPNQSLDPRTIAGVVHGIGAQPDTANYALVAGATVVLSSPQDTIAGTSGRELARATSKSDGSFSLGQFKPGVYMVTVTPPAGSPYRGTSWAFVVSPFARDTVPLDVWLRR
ncbi:MAG: hypothetical protein ABJF01_07205 [bacterium]